LEHTFISVGVKLKWSV